MKVVNVLQAFVDMVAEYLEDGGASGSFPSIPMYNLTPEHQACSQHAPPGPSTCCHIHLWYCPAQPWCIFTPARSFYVHCPGKQAVILYTRANASGSS